MKYLFMLIVLSIGCTNVPFDEKLCIEQCSMCPGIPCNTVCSQLQEGFSSETCKASSSELWECAIQQGCYFPNECSVEIENFLACED